MERKITNKEREEYVRRFKALTIQSDFMFCKVMQDKKICAEVLNILLKDFLNKLEDIKLVTFETSIENHPSLKYVRLDVLAEDESGNSYDIEMQVVNRKNIAKRMRTYQASIDMFKTPKGMDYNKITDTIIIFLCPFDPFGRGLPVYFFEYCCKQDPSIRMQDGAYRAIFNTSAWIDVADKQLSELLKFFHTGEATEGVAKEMKMKVDKIKNDSIIAERFVSSFSNLVDARNDGRLEGKLEGRLEGRLEGKLEGKLEGRLEGRLEGYRDVAKKLLSLGIPIENITEATGLSHEEIRQFHKNI